jgi:hypothetical protein
VPGRGAGQRQVEPEDRILRMRQGVGCVAGPGQGERDPKPVGVGNAALIIGAGRGGATGPGRRHLLRGGCHRYRHLRGHRAA